MDKANGKNKSPSRRVHFAREYNIPAVLATGDATIKLKDGDIVLVNAAEGSVTVLS